MIKLTDLLNEQESFTATSKKSGEMIFLIHDLP